MMTWLFGCSHKDYTFPLTVKRRTYVACLECGKEFSYDFNSMRIVQEVQKAPMVKKRAQVIEIGEFKKVVRFR